MKKYLQRAAILALSLAVAAALMLAAVFFMTRGMVAAADGFLRSAKANDFVAARTFLAQGFRDTVDDRSLKFHITHIGLSRARDTRWDGASVTLGRGELRGTVITDANTAVPVMVTFVREGGAWRIYSLHRPPAGFRFESTALAIPSREEQLELVQKSWGDFTTAVSRRSMKYFHERLSALWQAQTSVDKLNEDFAPLVSGKVTLPNLNELLPRPDGDAILDTTGALVVKGHYASTPKPVQYELRYVHEGAWRLSGFFFKME